jgi:hypothetical protein
MGSVICSRFFIGKGRFASSDGATAFLCRMKKIGSITALLRKILESDAFLKIGRNVKKDITKLAEGYKCDLIPKEIIEIGSFSKFVGYGNGRAGLSELASAFLKQSLEKRDNISQIVKLGSRNLI